MDKTTEGYEAEPEEVEAVLHNLCGYHLAERDPLYRYTVLTREQVLYDALVAAIRRERGRALAELATGRTLKQVAEMANLGTRQRVARLIAIAKVAEEAAAEVQAASLAFEEQFATAESAAVHIEPVEGITDQPSVGGSTELVEVPIVPGAAGVAHFDESAFGGVDDSVDTGALLGPTLSMPTLTAVLHPTREMPSPEDDDLAWWRQRDTGAA